jgi:hypothetical protein
MTTLKNTSYIDIFDKNLKAYDTIFFKKINGQGVLFEEASTIKQIARLDIPTSSSATTYSTAQFANFIRNIINFNIKNYDQLDNLDNNMGFVKKDVAGYSFNENVKTNIIDTLKVINVFVDILGAYKHCIETATDTTSSGFASGYDKDTVINRIEIVSDKTRFYTAANTSMLPANTVLNAGFIRKIREATGGDEITVLYLSIQSFNTGLVTPYNYDDIFNKTLLSGATATSSNTQTEIFDYDAVTASTGLSTTLTLNSLRSPTYASHKYDSKTPDPAKTNLTLAQRNKNLITILLKTLFNIDIKFRKQSVYALYYYYKFVQLYSTLIINVSNVMYADVPSGNVTPTIPLSIETRNATKNGTYPISAITITAAGSGYTSSSTISFTKAGSEATTPTTATATLIIPATGSTGAGTVTGLSILTPTTLGSGYKAAPTIAIATAGTGATALATIVPIVTHSTEQLETKMGLAKTKTKNIQNLADIMEDIEAVLTTMITDISSYDNQKTTAITISTNTAVDSVATTRTTLYKSTDNRVIIKIVKSVIYASIVELDKKNDLINDFTIYDNKNRIYYNIISVNDAGTDNFQIEIDAVFAEADKTGVNENAPVFKGLLNDVIANKPANTSTASTDSISPSSSAELEVFLKIQLKDIDGYKSEYIVNRDEVEGLNEKIGSNTNKVAYQKSLYEAQNSKNIFLERQILLYNVIIGIIILILVVINIVKIENPQLIKTISQSCLGIILLLFVIYFISNITYIETFADVGTSGNRLNKLTSLAATVGVNLSSEQHNKAKVTDLNTELDKLNKKFISYFEKLIIMIPSFETRDFYREIKEVVSNDIDNKRYINSGLEYNKSQGSNNINSLKYELENNKLYINTILISAIIFIGIYNLYIYYDIDDKYQALVIFICILIFIVIVSYYIITMNRRVKTVFKNIYWGPENSERF